jgi:peptide/nickel transport system substrate-binding protein
MPEYVRSHGRFNRRDVLGRAAAFGLAGSIAPALVASDVAEASPSTAAARTSSLGGSSLRVLPAGAPTTFDPGRWTVNIDHWAMSCLFEGLVTFRPGTTRVVNQLAQSFKPSADGLRYDFVLKKGIQFHGGYGEVTAEDVKYSYERIAGLTKPKEVFAAHPDWATLKEVKVTGKYSGTIVLKSYFAPIMNTVLPVSSGYIISKKAALERGARFQTQPIGTGPYQLEKYAPGQTVRLRRFNDYGKASGAIAPPTYRWDTIEIVLSATQTGDVALQAGDVTFAVLPVAAVDRIAKSSFEISKAPTVDFSWLNMNILAPKLSNINVRKAVRYAVDVPAVLEGAWYNKWRRATAAIAPNVPVGYWPGAPKYDRNLDKARSYMKDANVKSLSLDFTIDTTDQGASLAAQIIQSNLADIGIETNLVQLDNSTFYTLNSSLRKRELMLANWTSYPDPTWAAQWFTCNQFDVWNWMYMCNKKFDNLNAKALAERNRARRGQTYVEMQKLWDAAVGAVWLAWPTSYFGHARGLKASFTPWGNPILWNFT